MKRAWQIVLCGVLLFAVGADAVDKINLLLGQQKTLEVRDVTKVAVGDGAVLNVKVISPSELLLSGLSSGLTTMTIWNASGQKETLTVQVYAQNPEQIQREVATLLQVEGTPIEGVSVRVVGDRVIIDGQVFKDDDAARVEAVAALYPSVTNLTTFNRSYNQVKRLVQLDFHFYEMQRDDSGDVGINWADIVDPINPQVTLNYVEPINVSGADGSGSIEVDNTFNPLRLRAEYSNNRLLHHHKMVVRSGEPAHYLEGGTTYIIAQSATGPGTIRDVEFGFVVDVTPEVDKADNVLLKVDLSFSVPRSSDLIAGFPTFEERAITTTANLALGQTLMLSGFLTETFGRRALGVPGFAKLPVIGALFGSHGFLEQQTDGVLFITPSVVRGVGAPGEHPFIRGIVDRYRSGSYRRKAGTAGE